MIPETNMETDKKSLRDEALAYHAEGRPGKIEVIPTKPYIKLKIYQYRL